MLQFPLQINHIYKLYSAFIYGMIVIINKKIFYNM